MDRTGSARARHTRTTLHLQQQQAEHLGTVLQKRADATEGGEMGRAGGDALRCALFVEDEPRRFAGGEGDKLEVPKR